MNKHYWLLEYWTGTIGYYDSFLVTKHFQTANEALEYAAKYCTRKFYLSKQVIP